MHTQIRIKETCVAKFQGNKCSAKNQDKLHPSTQQIEANISGIFPANWVIICATYLPPFPRT